MKNKHIFTNGTSLFTLENYGKTAGVCHEHGITFHCTVSVLKARCMHSTGSLHYVFGTGDRKALAGIKVNKRTKLENFEVR